jgi:hypothetical protein
MPLGNLKKIGLISKNPYQVYVPFNPNDKTYLSKKEPAVSEVEQTSLNEKPKFLADQIGKGNDSSSEKSKVSPAVMEKMMHPQFTTQIYLPEKKKKSVSVGVIENLQAKKETPAPLVTSEDSVTPKTVPAKRKQKGYGKKQEPNSKLWKF